MMPRAERAESKMDKKGSAVARAPRRLHVAQAHMDICLRGGGAGRGDGADGAAHDGRALGGLQKKMGSPQGCGDRIRMVRVR